MKNQTVTINIDLKGVKSEQEVFDAFHHSLKFAYIPGNWASLNDFLGSLDTESKPPTGKYKSRKWPSSIHLIIKNIKSVEKLISKNAYCVLLSALAHSTDKHDRYDDLKFTFEIDNSEIE